MNNLSKPKIISRLIIAAHLSLFLSISHATEQQTCITDEETAEKLGMFYLRQYSGSDSSVRKAYIDFLSSGLIEYDSDRPVVYAIDYYFTKFFKRKCHSDQCDIGDIHGTREVCAHFTNTRCELIAATKGKDLYCFLVPRSYNPSREEDYDPFKQ